MERLDAAIQRDLFVRMRLRIAELEQENAHLRAENERLHTYRPEDRLKYRLKYLTEEERREAHNRATREYKRRVRAAAKVAA